MQSMGAVTQRLGARFRIEGPQVVRIVVAAALSWQICIWAGAQQPPVFAVVVPLVALRDHPYSVFNLSFDRMVGVIFGVLLAEVLVGWLGVSLLAVTVVLALGLTIGIVLRIGATLNVQVAVSAMLVFASPEPGTYGVTRIWETVIAAVVCVLISPLLLPPNARRTFETELARVTGALSEQLVAVQELLRHGAQHEDWVALRERAVATEEASRLLPTSLSAAERAVRFNPLRRSDVPRLAAYSERVRLAADVARVERLLLDEAVDLSERPDLTGIWPDFVAPMSRVLTAAAAAVRAAFDGADGPGIDALLVEGDAEIMAWRDLDARPITAVIRRPLRRLLDLLAGVAGDPGSP